MAGSEEWTGTTIHTQNSSFESQTNKLGMGYENDMERTLVKYINNNYAQNQTTYPR